MKRYSIVLALSPLCILVFVQALAAQALITGENGGKGSRSVMISANAIQPKDFGTLSNMWIQYGQGVSDRVDVFLSYGNIRVFGVSQNYTAIGSNVGLLRRSRAGVDVSFYNNASLAIDHRQQASHVLLGSALVASRPLTAGEHRITAYGGASRLTPIGMTAESIFTPPAPVYNGIFGVSVAVSKSVTLFLEYNPGSIQRSGGTGALYAFPQGTTAIDTNPSPTKETH